MQRKNLVTAEHAGQRVTFQYELPNGYVGEVVGFLQWFDEAARTYVVEDKDGRLVRVPEKGVRHGKIVPTPAFRSAPEEGSDDSAR